MVAVIDWFQAAQQIAQQVVGQVVAPIALSTIIEAFAGICALWILNVVIKTDKKITKFGLVLYGDPDVKESAGLIDDATKARTAAERLEHEFHETKLKDAAWQQDLTNQVASGVTMMEAMKLEVEARLTAYAEPKHRKPK